MYDDLSSLAEKLQLPNVSFQVMKDEKESASQSKASEPLEAEQAEMPEANGVENADKLPTDSATPASTIVHMATKTQQQNRKIVASLARSSTVAPAPSAPSEPSIIESAVRTRPQDPLRGEKNPVRLDRLFATIGKRNI